MINALALSEVIKHYNFISDVVQEARKRNLRIESMINIVGESPLGIQISVYYEDNPMLGIDYGVTLFSDGNITVYRADGTQVVSDKPSAKGITYILDDVEKQPKPYTPEPVDEFSQYD